MATYTRSKMKPGFLEYLESSNKNIEIISVPTEKKGRYTHPKMKPGTDAFPNRSGHL
jgi:hypothetical protein